jgi:hypothetical protein
MQALPPAFAFQVAPAVAFAFAAGRLGRHFVAVLLNAYTAKCDNALW